MQRLKRIELRGFKSIRTLDLELRPLNVMIGANGAGKSNLVSFFKMIHEMMAGRLQLHVAASGRSSSILHFGPKITPQMEARLAFAMDDGEAAYNVQLRFAPTDTLVVADEMLEFPSADGSGEIRRLALRSAVSSETGPSETYLTVLANVGKSMKGPFPDDPGQMFLDLLRGPRIYQFNDTSPTAFIRQPCYADDNRCLAPDGRNLAAVLYRLKRVDDPKAYRRIVGAIRQIAPTFADFDLEPTLPGGADVVLNWRERTSDQVFGPHQLSDGTLRAMAIITLLLQPVADLPNVIVIDEPELGLHPYAKNILASLMKKASCHCQIIVATQSAGLIESFEPEDIVVVEQTDEGSTFQRQDSEKLREWLTEYTMRELWEKNVLGGGPA